MILTELQETQIELEATRMTLDQLRKEMTDGIVQRVSDAMMKDVSRVNWLCDSYNDAGLDLEQVERETLIFERTFAAQKKSGMHHRDAFRAAVDAAILSKSNKQI